MRAAAFRPLLWAKNRARMTVSSMSVAANDPGRLPDDAQVREA
ncbi:hypothetical protein ACIBHY_49290 [Nonomuraea sp. NPDC050547]